MKVNTEISHLQQHYGRLHIYLYSEQLAGKPYPPTLLSTAHAGLFTPHSKKNVIPTCNCVHILSLHPCILETWTHFISSTKLLLLQCLLVSYTYNNNLSFSVAKTSTSVAHTLTGPIGLHCSLFRTCQLKCSCSILDQLQTFLSPLVTQTQNNEKIGSRLKNTFLFTSAIAAA